MKKAGFILGLTVLFTLVSFSIEAKESESQKRKKKGGADPGTVANCSPATNASELNINNARALIQTGGDMWWDFNVPRYEVPKGSGRNALFSGALWMGGEDRAGQLKVAALRFRNEGNDFWPGPLSKTNAEISPETCNEYDRHFETTRDEVAEFVAWFDADDATKQILFPDYEVPQSIQNWPGNGRNFEPYNEDFYLAPYVSRSAPENPYDWRNGDYPAYDLKGEADCSRQIVNVFGDQNLWWIFNDKGNVHTETGSNSIGMEIRAQAFAFATNDEVNNMTFYNYELINRSTFTLTNTYFGQWVDGDLGGPNDDYVGCDVGRGLGYFYNGRAVDLDEGGALGYGDQPPAVGVDFFQGPFQDADLIANEIGIGPNEALNGVGYGDDKLDNERFGMRRFLYHHNSNPTEAITDPMVGTEYYNYLRGIWKDGNKMTFGGNGYNPTEPTALEADFMFPGDTDPLNWGTKGIDPGDNNWTEETAGNTPGDRRFIQSAGPFTLAPGAVNNITVGVAWARASSGGPFASVEALRKADDKTQQLFDSCFDLFTGPDAPNVSIQEMDQEIIIYLSNPNISNNVNESYARENRFLTPPPTMVDTNSDDSVDVELTPEEINRFFTYNFQGYQIYQLKDGSVSADELIGNEDRARLVAQVDIKDGVAQLVNYRFDDLLKANVPTEMVNGEDEGISHAFRITQDKFATGDNRLINHKQYYFMAIAYASNNYGNGFGNLQYLPEEYTDPNNEAGQQEPYIGSRKAASGAILVYSAIPHKTESEGGGTEVRSAFGDGVPVTRIEGRGTGGFSLQITSEDEDKMFENGANTGVWKIDNPTYEANAGPVGVKVIDPLSVQPGDYTLMLQDTLDHGDLTDATWLLINKNADDSVVSERSIEVINEQLILDLGISISFEQQIEPATLKNVVTPGLLSATITFEDEGQRWLTGVPDLDGFTFQNWIRCGTSNPLDDEGTTVDESLFEDYHYTVTIDSNSVDSFWDPEETFEQAISGTWAPFSLTSAITHGPVANRIHLNEGDATKLAHLPNVDIVITSDKSRWTRCPVLEMQDESTLSEGAAEKGFLREAPSVDKNGVPVPEGIATSSNNPDDANYISASGMGWFPGYAIDIETGERLNMAFGEDSWLQAENGRDMVWNPTENISEGFFGDIRFGGKHYVYVFRHDREPVFNIPDTTELMPAYDAGRFLHKNFSIGKTVVAEEIRKIYRAASWVGLPLLGENQPLLPEGNDVRISLRVNKPFRAYPIGKYLSPSDALVVGERYFVNEGPVVVGGETFEKGVVFNALAPTFTATNAGENLVAVVNDALPLYQFNLDNLAPLRNNLEVAEDALEGVNIVPNPYYAYSQYEATRLDNEVKIINLPDQCTITIYTVSGTLIRSFRKDDPTTTSVSWDLTNFANVPIASGMYIVHIDAPGVGEKVLKWMGIIRPIDLDSF